MSGLNLKYTRIDIEVGDADGKDYHGYMSVHFNYDNEADRFFMDAYDDRILQTVREFMNKMTGGYKDKDISIEDTSILINLVKSADKALGPDLAAIVRAFEQEFDQKVGLQTCG